MCVYVHVCLCVHLFSGQNDRKVAIKSMILWLSVCHTHTRAHRHTLDKKHTHTHTGTELSLSSLVTGGNLSAWRSTGLSWRPRHHYGIQMLTVRACFPIKALIQINLNDHTQGNVEEGGLFYALFFFASLPSFSILPLLLRRLSFFHPVASLIVSITSSVHQCNSTLSSSPPPPPPPGD